MKIKEVFMGTGGAETAQFVELRTTATNQNKFVEHDAVIKLYGATGNLVSTATFATDPNNASTSGAPILAATSAAATLFGVTPDVTFSSAEIRAAGAACFESDQGRIDCVSWGDFNATGFNAGNPENPSNGILSGASILRDDGDSNNSNADFSPATPIPNGGGAATQTPPRFVFGTDRYNVEETDGEVLTLLGYSGEAIDDEFSINYSAAPGTAEPNDFGEIDEGIIFVSGDNLEQEPVEIDDDSNFEGEETVKLALRDPTNGALLGDQMNSKIVINDIEDDNDPPTTKVNRPEHGKSYARSKFTAIKGVSDDGPGDVAQAFVGLRKTLKNGNCKWLGSSGFVTRACSSKKFLDADLSLNGAWIFRLEDPLAKSVGTKVKFYTAFARALDEANLQETEFEKGRNANKFEIT